MVGCKLGRVDCKSLYSTVFVNHNLARYGPMKALIEDWASSRSDRPERRMREIRGD